VRTTITLDPDVHGAVQQLMRERGLSFKEAVNTAIRLGLIGDGHGDQFTFPTHRMGRARIHLDKSLAVAAAMEDEELLHKRQLRK
jgi:hypothetical protein